MYHSKMYHISLFSGYSGRNKDMETQGYTMFCYDTIEVENSLTYFMSLARIQPVFDNILM